MGRQNQSSAESNTDSLKTEDESVPSNLAGTTIPLSGGTAKTAIRWLSPLYQQKITPVLSTSDQKEK